MVLHVGANDTLKPGSEPIMGRVRQAIREYQEARSEMRATVCGIPNRLDKLEARGTGRKGLTQEWAIISAGGSLERWRALRVARWYMRECFNNAVVARQS